MSPFYIGTNWKMHKNWHEAESYCKQLAQLVANLPENLKVFIIPPYIYLDRIKKLLANSRIQVGAQNMHWENEGPYTGEISPMMLADININLVELGHSERRLYYRETDEDLAKKVAAALAWKFETLLCIGETKLDYLAGAGQATLERQLRLGLTNVSAEDISRLRVAYEPVWSIGEGGTPAASEYVMEVHNFIRALLVELFGEEGTTIPLLYGGSVNQGNFSTLAALENVNGLFIGRSAWDIKSFSIILNQLGNT